TRTITPTVPTRTPTQTSTPPTLTTTPTTTRTATPCAVFIKGDISQSDPIYQAPKDFSPGVQCQMEFCQPGIYVGNYDPYEFYLSFPGQVTAYVSSGGLQGRVTIYQA